MLVRKPAAMVLLAASMLLFGNCGGSSTEPLPIALKRAFPNLTFNSPISMVQAPGDDSTWFLIEKEGRVLSFNNDDAAASTFQSLDISSDVDDSNEGGLLGIAFHPSFSGSGHVFLYFTETGPDPKTPVVSRVSRFYMGTDLIITPASESVVLSINQPDTNHNGGDIKFGPDGYLYIALGDGGGSGDPNGSGQDTTNLLGSILRIDVDAGSPYAIPAGNFFASSGTDMPEIYAWGLRNPWRFTFDEVAEDLWAGDVGQGSWEEIDLVTSGGNYGWNIKEGTHCYSPSVGCDETDLIDPVFEYGRSEGRSVTGGYVYRGTDMPAFYGHYLFADWASGKLWGIDAVVDSPEAALLAETGIKPVSFAQDQDLELYILDYDGGAVYRLVQTP